MAEEKYVPRLYRRYKEEVVPLLIKRFGYKNIMQVPKIAKVTVNMGVGEAVQDVRQIERAMEDLMAITGQKPQLRRAKKSEAGFKLRKGMPIGARVTLRKERMWDFLDKLISVALPRVKDFKGLNPRSFDGRGNYSFGLAEQIVFPEIDYDKVDRIRGMDINIHTTAQTDEEAYWLLSLLGLPIRAT
ncbi:MAG TPA: 50S ribosomal protein L5 [Aquifex aeolicus]|uniref:Large ribosomal subunit protein uL5 n=1 Tax=Aquifex aeolicus TaxID=63363 RepID=A0A9D1CFK0_AQUAO|nr:50S ribosomal protein L5 [Aquificales bacterium]HIP86297.1 50S ribosomal protein L5 [Aquifex sp.]HIP98516.1 50S ribosomal protein L5 [Aquifex aeolicus]HIQ26247.1 50S ribosomal protein L5 [Aquifex aeolicus]